MSSRAPSKNLSARGRLGMSIPYYLFWDLPPYLQNHRKLKLGTLIGIYRYYTAAQRRVHGISSPHFFYSGITSISSKLIETRS